MQHVDIVIIGGGMVGLALACSLQNSGLHIIVLERYTPKSLVTNALQVLRVSTINIVSKELLMYLGVWSDVTAFNASYFNSMEVWDKDSFGCITFDNKDLGYSHLGYIIENTIIQAALWQKAQQCSNITLIAPAHLQQVIWDEDKVIITLQNNDMLTARLVIGADGANSWLRDQAKIPLTFWNYRHHALVATVRTVEPHSEVARQVFHGNGILAFLPLRNPYLCSIVWALTPDRAQQMYENKKEIFNQMLCMTFDNRLGLCTLEGERQIFPLTGRYAHQFAGHRLVLVGDAAHTIHPLAGQGLNLGFMDVIELTEELRRLHYEGKDIGQYLYLRRYERRRKYKTAIMLMAIQGFYELFNTNYQPKKLLRNIGLKLVNIIPGAKLQLIRQAIGLKDLPNWLRKI